MKLNRLTEWLTAATAPMLALGALTGAVSAGIIWLQVPLSKTGFFSEFWALSIAAILPGMAAVMLLWACFHIVARNSHVLRAERFDLRVRSRHDLFGRDTDAEDLCALVRNFSLVFIDGESGSGKSSLVAHGLIPLVREKTRLLPILISEYSGDWEAGLNRRTYETIWSALNEAERTRLRISDHTAPGNIDAELIARLLKDSACLLGQKILLLFDQFDDYQLAHRSRFLDERQTWLQPTALKTANAFWRAVDEARLADHATLVFVIRSDAASGLHSVRFAESYAARQVLRLKSTWLPRLLNQVDADDGKGPVIAHPDDGWSDLKHIVELDLNKKGTILPQQVRIALLGLRDLKPLTPAQYRRVGRTAGVEALYIQGAMESAAGASGADVSTIRSVLLELIERGPENTVKTVQRSDAHLSRLFASEAAKTRALERLRLDEIVRLVQHEGDAARWQLDHDYLAIAIAAEERASNRYAIVLRDGADAWQRASSDWYESYRALLPMRTQLMLAWATVASRLPFTTRSALSYRPYQRYATISLGRFAPLLFVLFGASGWVLWTGSDSYQIQRMIASAEQVKVNEFFSAGPAWADALVLSSRVEDALAFARNTKSSPLKAQMLAHIAGRLAEKSQLDKAITIFDESMTVAKDASEGDIPSSYQSILAELKRLVSAGAHAKVRQMVGTIHAALLKYPPTAKNRISVALKLADLYRKLSLDREALALLQQLLPISKESPFDATSLAVQLHLLGDDLHAKKLLSDVIPTLFEGKFSSIGELPMHLFLSGIYRQLRLPAESATHLQRAIDLAMRVKGKQQTNASDEENDVSFTQTDGIAQIGVELARVGRYELVSDIVLRDGDIIDRTSALVNAAGVAFQAGKIEYADRFMRLANSQVQNTTTPFQRAKSLELVATGYKKTGQTSNHIATLLDAYRAALAIPEIYVASSSSDGAINKLSMLIDLSKKLKTVGRLEESRNALRLAESLSKKTATDPSFDLPELAYILAEDGQLKSARRVAEQVRDENTRLRAFAQALGGYSSFADPAVRQLIADELKSANDDL